MIFFELYLAFLKIGLFSIGGGYVMLPLIQKEAIETHAWLTLHEFVDILAIAEITPGPIAINSATFVGFRIGGFLGAFLATAGVITPSLVFMVTAAGLLSHFSQNNWMEAALKGLRPAVLSLITGAAVFIGRASLLDLASAAISAAALIIFLKTRIHPVVILILAAITGIVIYL